MRCTQAIKTSNEFPNFLASFDLIPIRRAYEAVVGLFASLLFH